MERGEDRRLWPQAKGCRPLEAGADGKYIHPPPAGGGSAVLHTLGPGLRPQAAGEGASGPSCGASLQQPQEVGQAAVPEPCQAGPSSSRRVPPPGHLSGAPPCPGPGPRASSGQRKEAAPPRGLSTLSSPPSENLTSGDTSKPQAELAEADGHGWVCPTPWGILASRIAEALPNLDPAQLPGPSEGPERTSVLRVGPHQGGE